MSKKATAEIPDIRITRLEAKKERLFENVQSLYNQSLKVSDPLCKAQFLARVQSIEKTRTEFISTVDEIITVYLELDPTLKPNYNALNSFDELYCYVKHAEQTIKDSSIKDHADLNHGKKLPLLQLLQFDGFEANWPLFYENFKCIIHDNPRLSACEKAQYLIGQLKGKALLVCSAIPATGANYELMWNALIKRYQDVRVQASLYVNQMLNVKANLSVDTFIEQFVTAEAAVRRLEVTDLSDFIITHIALSKLDKELVNLFEQTHKHIEIPKFNDLSKFLSEQSKILALRNNSLNVKSHQINTRAYKDNKPKSSSVAFVVNNDTTSKSPCNNDKPIKRCALCNENDKHPLFKCSQFLKLEPDRRIEVVKEQRCCENCLGFFHDIKSCKSQRRCFCGGKHHSLTHVKDFKEISKGKSAARDSSINEVRPIGAGAGSSAYCVIDNDRSASQAVHNDLALHASSTDKRSEFLLNKNKAIILPTATVYVYNSNNERSDLRVLVDTASTSNFVTKQCCERLKLSISTTRSTVQGIGQIESTCIGFVTFKIHSRYKKNCAYVVHARVIDSITDKLPNEIIDTAQLSHFKNLFMADNQWEIPAPIDCLLGNGIVAEILGGNKITSEQSSAVAIESTLGYLTMGKANYCHAAHDVHRSLFCSSSDDTQTLTQLTERFWELESVPNKVHISPDDEACEKHFASTYSRDSSGTFEVQLPFKEDPNALGDSYSTAKKRLLTLEKKLDASPELRANYNATLQDYIDKGYLAEVDDFKPDSESYYIPHRAVYRPDSSSTKTRIVLDASCPTTSGKSLNDILYKGLNLQCNIFDLLINLRIFSTAISADIEKMYFQVKLAPEHRPYQRILYRFTPDSDIRIFEFNRIAFGLSSSPFLAMRCIRELASQCRDRWPLAAYEAEHSMYMDDYVNSVDGTDKAIQVYNEMIGMFQAGGFNLVKWISNDSSLIEKIPNSRKNPQLVEFGEESLTAAKTKIVGMQWQPAGDHFQFQINSDLAECTKRTILSATARHFDPIGLLSPVTAFMKLLVQECWSLNLSWDEPVPQQIHDKWIKFREELPFLALIKIPRHVGIRTESHVTLIGFGDASESCYGACVYVRVSSDDGSPGSVNLLAAKSKVAPLKKTTLARLELCSSVLLTTLINAVRETLEKRLTINNIYAFSDSTVTLSWIHAPAHKFNTFVANRIADINSKLPATHWHKIASAENPADIISRPVTPRTLVTCDMWFHGPQWLREPIHSWPIKEFKVNINEQIEESKQVTLYSNETHTELEPTAHPIEILAERVSKWMKFLRIMVYVLRFINRLPKHEPISVAAIEYAETYVIKYVQSAHFATDIKLIKANKVCSKRILKLSPFIDEEGIVRAGGRLKHSELSYGQKHPIILPAKERIVQLIVDHFHVENLHTGPSLLIALLRQKFWILASRNLVRKRVHACHVCFRLNPRYSQVPMGELPEFRCRSFEAKTFSRSSVDYGGPYFVTHIRRRGVKSQKAYICLFTCLATKSLHAELVSELSTELFLAAFKRFISRRGPVSMIYSDYGTNFCGARPKLNEIYEFIQSTNYENYINQELLAQRIEFKHSPPYGPHFNGLAESNIRCVKKHLDKVVGLRILTYEELNTVLVQIEGLLNSRPLCVLSPSSDPAEVTALTPNHFLNVTPLKFLPAKDFTNVPDNRLSRFELVSKLTHLFWRRWSQEYLTSLQQREKWNTTQNPVKIGSIVIIKDQNSHPLVWPIGVVEEVYPGKDSVVRTCKVRTGKRSFIRPVIRLAPLPNQ